MITEGTLLYVAHDDYISCWSLISDSLFFIIETETQVT